MIDKYFEWNIDGIQANTVLENAEVNIPIDKTNYRNIFTSEKILILLNGFEDYIKEFFKTNDNNLSSFIINQFKLRYLIKNNTYYIGFDYNYIFNNILKKLKINKPINIKNINDTDELYKTIYEINKDIALQEYVSEFDTKKIWNKDEEKILDRFSSFLDVLISYMKDIETVINDNIKVQIEEEKTLRNKKKNLSLVQNKCIEWKNLMLYTACKALNIYDENKDIKYYRYAKNYYLNVSRDKNAEYPSSMYIDDEYYDYRFSNFNKKFMEIQKKYFSALNIELGIEDLNVINCETLTKGEGNIYIADKQNSNPKNKIDLTKTNESLQRKIKFYNGLKGKIKAITKDSLSSDTNYIGFILDNNYIIYEKFFEISKKSNELKPAYGNAVYVVTLDVAYQCHFDKKEIRKYIKKNHDYKAFKFNHTENDSYQKRIGEILEYSDISTIKYKELKLINENKQNN